MAEVIFIIGPGGAGKSTTGVILSQLIGYKLLDLDTEFCDHIQNIRDYIRIYGYEAYLQKNSDLLELLLKKNADVNLLVILSSGFLSTDICENIVIKNRRIVEQRGMSILLLPSQNDIESLECIVKRQLQRGFSLTKEKEEKKFSQRFYEYIKLGDIKIFSMDTPEKIAHLVFDEIKNHRK
ncbi:shikimate kinase (plasmid) [Salmonella enterica subsp. enterica serovar Karamoja]|uniref:Shikimate kinase n=1 Tax=Salmonella enterica subsp. enterica serovar Karamoja TaxID=2500153 RepID=A0A3Q9MX81_SALET|nr:shikimate kinase [Salmonella enterica]AZT39599.1 shikimate kinase [Salmonella enterica subsp. enterica serovar Karamoja]AZT44318.1 shikimate kinase [Salmonella enterica subsp. enterica serovar Karamoja]